MYSCKVAVARLYAWGSILSILSVIWRQPGLSGVPALASAARSVCETNVAGPGGDPASTKLSDVVTVVQCTLVK